MNVMYIDEAGCLGTLPSATSNIQPIFVFLGITFNTDELSSLTEDFLNLKRKFFPKLHTSVYSLDGILVEVKGSQIRKDAAKKSRRPRRAAFRFLSYLLSIVEKHKGGIFGRIWIKDIGVAFNGRSVYTFSMQDTCNVYQEYLKNIADFGFVIADSRDKPANSNVSHSIYTQKFHPQGDKFPNLIEMPTFGHSDNHAGLQIADLICSGIIFPMAIETYCKGHISNVHVRDYSILKSKYSDRIRDLQFRYQDDNHKTQGGLIVSDALTKRSGSYLFR